MSDIDLTEATKAAHKALAARWMTVASALAEDEDYPQILTDVLHAALPEVVRKAKAQGWDEGHYMSDLTWRHIYDGHDCSEGEVCPTCCQPNPYRAQRIESQDNERINHDLQH